MWCSIKGVTKYPEVSHSLKLVTLREYQPYVSAIFLNGKLMQYPFKTSRNVLNMHIQYSLEMFQNYHYASLPSITFQN